MFINSLRIGFAGLMISAVAAWAAPVGPSTLQGDVKDSKLQPVAGAEVHIQAKDGSNLQKIVRTDANGHYVCPKLPRLITRLFFLLTARSKHRSTTRKLPPPSRHG